MKGKKKKYMIYFALMRSEYRDVNNVYIMIKSLETLKSTYKSDKLQLKIFCLMFLFWIFSS